jgi:glycosyltransferase 2 family protein
MRLLEGLRPAAVQAAPIVLAVMVGAAGTMLLLSGATPSEPERLTWLMAHAPIALIEVSHFLSSIAGLVLILLAFGLRQRLDAAWAASVAVVIVAAALALLKGVNYEESVVLAVVFTALLPFHEAFPRQARLSRMEIKPGWLISMLLAFVGVGVLGLWSFQNADFGDMAWWQVMRADDADRAIRSSAGAGLLLLLVGLWRLFATAATPKVTGEDDPDFTRVRAILANAEDMSPEANLALLGDKRFLFSDSGRSFLMFGVHGRTWIALGAPVGLASERGDLLWKFRELADAHAARPGIYDFGPELLPDIIDMGLQVQKTGEAALIDLASFSVAGRRREVLRRNWRKAGESGAAFEVLAPEEVAAKMDELKAVSDDWLARHAGGEKGFSMGGFLPRFVAEFPCAVVRVEGRIVAFATLWTTPDRSLFSMDLMRYSDAAPRNIMDYLFVELFAWGREAGYARFEFGMAPLAGLADRRLAPLLTRMGRFFFMRGEEIYNFQGVRRYKDKFDPHWRPRYIAGNSKWAIPVLLTAVGLLSSGGVAGLTKRPAKAEREELPKAA